MSNVITKECPKHGNTEFFLKDRKYYSCKKCRIEAVARSRRKAKKTIVEEHGAKCSICGYNKCMRALHFHHVDPTTKSYGLSESGISRSVPKMREEAKKCVLVCSNCHMEIEDGITPIPV